MIRFRIESPDGPIFDPDEFWSEALPRAVRAVLKGVLIYEGAVKRKLSTAGKGRIYKSRSRTHRASLPGDPPALDTGRLRGSVDHTEPKVTRHAVEAQVGTNVEYARRLERGGRDSRGRYIAPRPEWEPAFRESEAAIDAALGEI
jgi:hypothetical protein